MNGIVAQYPDTELHVVLDNFVTHKEVAQPVVITGWWLAPWGE